MSHDAEFNVVSVITFIITFGLVFWILHISNSAVTPPTKQEPCTCERVVKCND